MYKTIEQAEQALRDAEHDTIADHGYEMLEQAWYDLVHAVGDNCTPEVRTELIRRNL